MSTGIESAPWFDSTWKGGEVSSRAFAVLAPNPSWETLEGTNTWILHEPGRRGCYVVDPGPDDEGHLRNVVLASNRLGLKVRAILVTHRHHDHRLGAIPLSQMIGAPVLSREDGNLPDGALQFPDAPELQVVSLPGHSGDSVGFVFPNDASVATGDVIFRETSTAIVWPDGNLKAFMETLDVLEGLVTSGVCSRFLSGHRRPVDDCLKTIGYYRERRTVRLNMVREALRETGSTDIDVLIPIAYRDVKPDYYPICRFSIKAQLAYLLEMGDPSVWGMDICL